MRSSFSTPGGKSRGSRRLIASALLASACTAVNLAQASADPTQAQSGLAAVTGQGTGLVTIAPTSAAQGSLDARVSVTVHDAAPNTTFAVTRGGGDASIDGVCTGTAFGQVATLATSSGGAGAIEFERSNPNTLSGSRFEVKLRLLGSDGTVLESQCMIVTVK